MDWQQTAALALVGLVVGAYLLSRWRRRGAAGCGAGCCVVKAPLGRDRSEARRSGS